MQKSGNAVIKGEDDYNVLFETLYVSSIPHACGKIRRLQRFNGNSAHTSSIPHTRAKIIERLNIPLS